MTKSEARLATDWFLLRMGLHDWVVALHVGKDRPSWAAAVGPEADGACAADATTKHAQVWVERGPLVLFYELLRVVLADIGLDAATAAQEFSLGCLARLVQEAWERRTP